MASSLWVSGGAWLEPAHLRKHGSANVILSDELSPRNCCQLSTAYKSIKLYLLSRG